MIKFDIEFYDHNGLVLYSGQYAPKEFEAENWKEVCAFTEKTLSEFGALYPNAKTVTARGLIPGNLFNSTHEARNPHFELSRAIHGVTLADLSKCFPKEGGIQQ